MTLQGRLKPYERKTVKIHYYDSHIEIKINTLETDFKADYLASVNIDHVVIKNKIDRSYVKIFPYNLVSFIIS